MSESKKCLSLSLPWRLTLAAVAGLLLAAGYGLQPLWWTPWLVPVALIPAVAGGRCRTGVVTGALSGALSGALFGALAGALATLLVVRYYFSLSGAGVWMILALRIASWSLAGGLTAALVRRFPSVISVFALPAAMAALEVVTLSVSVHGAAGSLAYSQMDVLPVVQLASLGGAPLIVFAVLLPGSLAGVWIVRGRTNVAALVATGGCVVAAGLFALVRLETLSQVKSVPVALIATEHFQGEPTDWNVVWQTYGPQVARHAAQDGVTVLPEKIALLHGMDIVRATQDIRATAMAARTTLIVGIETQAGGTYRNRALIAAPDGSVRGYDKQKLVPGFEARDVPGHTPLLAPVAGQSLGVAICKDMHFPSVGREYARKAAFMAVPAWDFKGAWGQDGWMGARMTALRGIESGYAIARSARDGYLGVYDAYGRVIAEAPSTPDMTVVQARVPAERVVTLYGRIGDVFGWLCCLLVACAVTAAGVRRDQIS